jgi:putative ABC transport system permease protein
VSFVILALRNLTRNRRRSALSLLIIAAGTTALLLTSGFIRFSFDGLKRSVIRSGLGHLEVLPRSDTDELEVATDRTAPPRLSNWQRLRGEIEATPHVVGASGAIALHGLATHGDRTTAFVGIGLEPDREKRMEIILRMRGGMPIPDLPPAEGEDQAILGRGLARLLGVGVGDTVTLTAVTEDRTLNAMDVRVCGLATTGLADIDARFVKLHLVSAQRLLATEAIASIIVGLEGDEYTASTRSELRRRLAAFEPPLGVVDWQARAPYYGQVRALYGGIFSFLGTIVFVLVSLAVSNTLLMAVMERIREIGTLLAIGTSRAQVVALVALESVWLGFIGTGLGCLLGMGVALALNAAEVRMPPPPGAAEGILLRLSIAPADLAWVGSLMLAVTLCGAILPAFRSARLRVVEALAHI